MTMTTSFNQLKPPTKALCISSLILTLLAAVALVVFGGVRLASDRWGGVTDIVSGKGGGGLPIGSSTRDDGMNDAAVVLSSGSPSPFDLTSTLPTLSPSTKYLRSMATYPPYASTSVSPHPTTSQHSSAPFHGIPTMMSDVIDDLHQNLGSIPPSNLPSTRPSAIILPTTEEQYETTSEPSASPSTTDHPASLPLSNSPSEKPTFTPLFPVHRDPLVASPMFFNYNTTEGSHFGPSSWGNVTMSNATSENYWSEFGFVVNQCNDTNVTQSPIDVCTAPEKHCLEYHEPRARGGNFKLTDQFMTKQILPNKLRLHITRKVANHTIPPSFDFASTGAKSLDLLNIDIKFPSEHTVCGRQFDGEMQYYFLHPVKLTLIVVAWLFEVKVGNPVNQHMQRLIDEFQEVYDINEELCRQNSVYESVMSTINHTMLGGHRKLPVLESLWNPFDRDIQKTIHFWGYTGSLTEPPCAGQTMWRIMDVPVQISMEQLNQMQNILFNNRDGATCSFTSNHYQGSVARPVKNPIPYYKCTRQDYKSDDEREICGEQGCDTPLSTRLDPYVDPIVYVTAPPSFAPTMSPMLHEDGQV